ncbi:MAG: hypothetical protein ABIR96_09605 [Bdellovibrionota bacterium]
MCITDCALALSVTATKVKVFSRSASIDEELAQFLRTDGDKNWESPAIELGENAKFEAKSKKFKIESAAEDPDSGDLARFRFFLTKKGQRKEPLSADAMSSVTVLAGEKFLILEPLVIIDTEKWVKTDLADSAKLSPYFKILRFSPKTSTLLVAQFDCAYDCPKDNKTSFWKITFK